MKRLWASRRIGLTHQKSRGFSGGLTRQESRGFFGGFTIVELLIVIVVIGILASIVIVAYNGVQDKAYDASTRSGADHFADALQLWSLDNGSTVVGDSGSTVAISGGKCTDGGGSGFVGKGIYPCTVEETLEAANQLPDGFVASLPKNTYYPATPAVDGRYSLMLYKCSGATGLYALYWTLRAPSDDDVNNLNSVIAQCHSSTNVRDTWGMRAGRLIQL